MGAGNIAGSLRNPAHYSGVYGHKPTWGLISTRGHAPPGIMTPTDISVVGPMARHAEDLDLALRAETMATLRRETRRAGGGAAAATRPARRCAEAGRAWLRQARRLDVGVQ
jgi:Asp-tRNA(Asn)/Glu-tRNA(Gln) amidotransferase A subunit family amidase